MDNTSKRKYRVDPLCINSIAFRAPHELVDRHDILICVEYSLYKRSGKDTVCADYWVWCRFQGADAAMMVCRGTTDIGPVCGSTLAIEGCILNEVLHCQSVVRAIQKFAGGVLIMHRYLEAVPFSGMLFVAIAACLPKVNAVVYILLAVACLAVCIYLCHTSLKWEKEWEDKRKKMGQKRKKPEPAAPARPVKSKSSPSKQSPQTKHKASGKGKACGQKSSSKQKVA